MSTSLRGFRASSSNSSILSYFRKNANASSSSAATPSTPPTSDPDVASISSETNLKANNHEILELGSSLEVVRELGKCSDHESLPASSRRRSACKSSLGVQRPVSGDTLLNREQEKEAEDNIIYDSIQVLDLDWKADTLLGTELSKECQGPIKASRQKSKSSDILESASDLVGKTKSILGKRSREVMEFINEDNQGVHSTSVDDEEVEEEEWEGEEDEGEEDEEAEVDDDDDADSIIAPAPKKARFSEEDGEIMALLEDDATPKKRRATPKARKPRAPKPYMPPNPFRRKTWLNQGLYVGQDPDFDPRLTETKNRLKRASLGAAPAKQRTMLPMPMFGGARMLEKVRDFRLPFDVYAPLPPGQPKPEEWKKVSKSTLLDSFPTLPCRC